MGFEIMDLDVLARPIVVLVDGLQPASVVVSVRYEVDVDLSRHPAHQTFNKV